MGTNILYKGNWKWCRFENLVIESKYDISYSTLSQLYEDPENLEIIEDEAMRMKARACIHQAVHSEYIAVYTACTEHAQTLASRFSQTEFIQQLVPESGILDALKKYVVPAVKLML